MEWKNALWPEWKVLDEIGSGAYGKVYKITRKDIGGTYFAALKVISIPFDENDIEELRDANMNDVQITEYYSRFADDISREFAVMERLKGNTNIVSYEDHKIVPHKDGIGWDVLIRMELLTPLRKYLEHSVCDEIVAIKLGIDMCNALSVCERENIIHRDIKPGNIFVSNFGDFKLGDFSIAKNRITEKSEHIPQGTYMYMSPEVYSRNHYDQTIDLYSLGLILYRMLNAGRPPFVPVNLVRVDHDVLEKANQRRLNGESFPKPANASVIMSAIILKACAFKATDRYQSPQEMKKALERCLSVQGTLDLSKRIAGYLKQASAVIEQYMDDKEDAGLSKTTNINDVKYKSYVKAEKKKEGKEFFMPAGDL